MKKPLFQRLADQRGVAMVTVLLVAAALTAVASAAAFTTIKEFRSSTQDRRSARALAYAEAGVDRMLHYLKAGRVNWSDIALAGCPAASRAGFTTEPNHPVLTLPGGGQGSVGDGSYTVHLEVFNPLTSDPSKRFAPGACTDPTYPRYWASPRLRPGSWAGAPGAPAAGITSQYFAIVATGASATSATPCPQLTGGACRTVLQVVRVAGVGLPVGIYAKTLADMTGNPGMDGISMITPGAVTGRKKASFKGLDPYYFVGDFTDWSTMPEATRQLHVPAAVHAGGSISLGGIIGNGLEHPTSSLLTGTSYLNCAANRTTGTSPGTPGQSMWDQSGPGYGGPIGGSETCTGVNTWTSPPYGPPNSPPPTSLIGNVVALAPQPDLTTEDYAALKQSAQADGIWCSFGAPQQCLQGGTTFGFGGTLNEGDITSVPNVFVAYFEWPAYSDANVLTWKSSWAPCTDDKATTKQVIVIVRRGNLQLTGGAAGSATRELHGAIIVPEGTVDERGGFTIDGTVIADKFVSKGNSSFKLSDCAVRNLPGPWLSITPSSWTEVDR